jgi:archaeal flagellin FlaB
MEKKYMERLIGKYCKIVTKEPGEDRASVVTGTLEDVDYQDGFILVDSEQGLGCLRINTIIAIKPGRKHKRIDEKKKIKYDNQAMVGIGTLIVFIAMILIAAVAASVLISTSEILQSRAKTVGTQTIKEVSSGVAIESVTGFTNEERTRIEYLAIMVRPRAGSKDIDLRLCTLTVLYENLSVLKLNTSLVQNSTDSKSIFETSILENLSSYDFGVIAIQDADSSVVKTHGMNTGDRVYILVNLTAMMPDIGGLPARGLLSGEFVPEVGIKSLYDITAPTVYSNRIVRLD